eukprot:3555881-Amphidinium_carterae.5
MERSARSWSAQDAAPHGTNSYKLLLPHGCQWWPAVGSRVGPQHRTISHMSGAGNPKPDQWHNTAPKAKGDKRVNFLPNNRRAATFADGKPRLVRRPPRCMWGMMPKSAP